ncbi:unnamed protein product [Brachionus calyciflorus]|uniref:Phospholipid/glycerol acyltransferase domain-containing protein n=1 Tax=Brachionus calyciflorus TaxID=104777 RepID=A0A813NGI1_9BILA|nr:unnamed protein product [Brachionus calyciflorus]
MLFPFTFILFFNRKLYHQLCDSSLKIWFGLSVFLLEKFCNIKIVLHESKCNKSESKPNKSSIVVMNHRTRFDWLFYFCILYRLNALSKIKIILKDSLKRISGPAWAMQTALFIFLKRKWSEDQITFNKFIDYYYSIQKSFMILIFPEGTDLTPNSIEKSNKFAEERNLSKYEYVLHPRVTGFNHIFNRMFSNDQIDCIHDVTVAYRGGIIPKGEADFLAESKGDKSENEILEEWINERWKIKENFLKNFYAPNVEIEELDKEYETKNEMINGIQLYFYPVYWIVSLTLITYLCFSFSIVQFYFAIALLFYIYQQFFSKNIDNFILNSFEENKRKTN